MKRIQHMPPVLFTVDWENLDDKNTYVWFYPNPKSDEKLRTEMPLKEALNKCANAERGGFEVFVSSYVPAFKQHMVVAMTTHGRLHTAFFGNPGKEAEKALAALLGSSNIQTRTGNPMPVQVIKPVDGGKSVKEEPIVKTVLCIFDEDVMMRPKEQCKPYEFITEEDLSIGDHRSCKTKNGKEKSVQVVKVMEPLKESQLAHALSWYVTLSKEWKEQHKKLWEIFENLDYKIV